jgi:Mrp family chromosome partitioning ATPase
VASSSPASDGQSRPGSLLDRSFILVAGKGGVGRTTVSAALARAAVARGRRVLLAQMDSPERLTRMLGAPVPVGPEVVAVDRRLDAVNMTAKSALHEYGVMVLRYEAVYRALFENRAVRGFLGAIPGLDAYAMLGKAWWHTTQISEGRPKYDLIIVDGPASGHAVRMLSIPQAILETVPKGPLARDAAAMRGLFTDASRSAILMVTLAEDLPARETSVLARQARELAMPLGPLVVNAVPSPQFGAPALGNLLDSLHTPGVSPPRPLAGILDGARLLRQWRQDAEVVLTRLRVDPGLPLVELPRLPTTDLGPADIAELAESLTRQLGSPEG